MAVIRINWNKAINHLVHCLAHRRSTVLPSIIPVSCDSVWSVGELIVRVRSRVLSGGWGREGPFRRDTWVCFTKFRESLHLKILLCPTASCFCLRYLENL
jgi:hypothetical protein